MILRIDFASGEPVYQQIRSGVVHAVATGELCAGDSLPSVRALASDLGVNMHTVNKAYAVLRDEGYVVMRRRSGAVVADRTATLSPAAQSSERERLERTLRDLALEHKARGGGLDEFVEMATAQAKRVYQGADGSGESGPQVFV